MTGIDRIIENALAEDIHTGDITTMAVVPKMIILNTAFCAILYWMVGLQADEARVATLEEEPRRFEVAQRDLELGELRLLAAELASDAIDIGPVLLDPVDFGAGLRGGDGRLIGPAILVIGAMTTRFRPANRSSNVSNRPAFSPSIT
jgi:hypothetical protein